ncbi:MAG: tryptophan synthase subunit alpha [Chitinophagaceae bacterium]|nr:MAG: tryptophan synthase subunit alpha [Chitinophagaceae bacterium]
MPNKLDILFASGKKNILNMYCTAGYPHLEDTGDVLLALQDAGADIIELGIPYSDPIADGPVIQQSNMQALANGISIAKIFEQLQQVKAALQVPVLLMGYLNPVMQYGIENFCKDAAACGVAAVILPDMPMHEFEQEYRPVFKKYGLHFIFLVTPQTSEARIREADKLSGGFLYGVSSAATTGGNSDIRLQESYFSKLQQMKLRNPILIGFGIKDSDSFNFACNYAAGAIIGTAYIRALPAMQDLYADTARFVQDIKSV